MSDDWREWSKHVILGLDRLDRSHESINIKLDKIETRLDEYNERLVKNTTSLEEHVRRTNILEDKVTEVEKCENLHPHGCACQPKDNQWVNTAVEVVVANRGIIIKILIGIGGLVASYYFSLKDMITKLFH